MAQRKMMPLSEEDKRAERLEFLEAVVKALVANEVKYGPWPEVEFRGKYMPPEEVLKRLA